MKIVFEYMSQSHELNVDQGSTVLDVLRQNNMSPDVTIAFIEKKPIPLDTEVREGMVLKAVSAVSGG